MLDYAGLILVTGPTRHDYRTNGLSFAEYWKRLNGLRLNWTAPLLVEGDGSRRRPLKSPAEHEPAVPHWVNGVVVCIGISGLGQPVGEEFVHRPEKFSQISGIQSGSRLPWRDWQRYWWSEQGGLKNIPAEAWRVVNINQVETPELAGQVKRLSEFCCPLLIQCWRVSCATRGMRWRGLPAGGWRGIGGWWIDAAGAPETASRLAGETLCAGLR